MEIFVESMADEAAEQQRVTKRCEELKKQTMLAKGDPVKLNFLFSSRSGREFQPGSNAWAIAGTHTASGKPLLANDPHRPILLPSLRKTVHLVAPGSVVLLRGERSARGGLRGRACSFAHRLR